jgi:hypothetical protein
MKPYEMLKLPVILLGFACALTLTPTCKAQEVSPDHFTDTGVADVYQAAPHHAAAPKPKQTPPALQTRNQRTDSQATMQLAATRNSSTPAQPGALAIPEKHKIAARKPKKSDR